MSTPVPTNETTTVVNTGIDGVFSASVTAAEAALHVALPWTNWPVIGPVINFLIGQISSKIYQYLSLCVSFTIIDAQSSGEVSDFNKALAALKAAQASGDSNAIQTALTNFQSAVSSLTVWDGANRPSSL